MYLECSVCDIDAFVWFKSFWNFNLSIAQIALTAWTQVCAVCQPNNGRSSVTANSNSNVDVDAVYFPAVMHFVYTCVASSSCIQKRLSPTSHLCNRTGKSTTIHVWQVCGKEISMTLHATNILNHVINVNDWMWSDCNGEKCPSKHESLAFLRSK